MTMPLYEYECGRCTKNFEELVSSAAATTPDCPGCGQSDEVARIQVAQLTIAKKENHRPPNIKSFTKPRRW